MSTSSNSMNSIIGLIEKGINKNYNFLQKIINENLNIKMAHTFQFDKYKKIKMDKNIRKLNLIKYNISSRNRRNSLNKNSFNNVFTNEKNNMFLIKNESNGKKINKSTETVFKSYSQKTFKNNFNKININQDNNSLKQQKNLPINLSYQKENRLNGISNLDINIFSFFKDRIKKCSVKRSKKSLSDALIDENSSNTDDEAIGVPPMSVIENELSKTIKLLSSPKMRKTFSEINFMEKKSNIKNMYYNSLLTTRGYFGCKDKNGLPFFYDSVSSAKNIYSNKSEKSRHELILSEFNKLKGYIERYPENRIKVIKGYLKNYNIDNLNQFNNADFYSLTKFICQDDREQVSSLLKPYLNLKEMLLYLLKNAKELNQKYFIDENKINFYDKENNQAKNEFYYSPLLRKKTFKSQNRKYSNENEPKKKFGELDLFDTKSNLKNLNMQLKIFKPQKNYSKNYNLILNEIGKEIKEIENNYYEKLKKIEKKNDELFFVTQYNKKCVTPDNQNKNFALLNRIYSSKINKRNKEKENEKLKPKKNSNINEMVKRLYYKPTRHKFGLDEIKKYSKLTEYIAIDVAKRNILLNKMKTKEFFE